MADNSVTLDENHVATLQEILVAIGTLPGVRPQIIAWMMARDVQDPEIEIEALRKMVF